MPEGALRDWHFGQLRAALQALATPAGQLTLFPDAAPKPNELAFRFEHWAGLVRTTYRDELSPLLTAALDAIDLKFTTISRDETEFGADTSTEWDDLRALAREALDAFGWAEGSAPLTS
jgi:hypothetical protein